MSRKRFIYVLRLEGDKYYVGCTTDLEIRIAEHFEGNGSAWTQLHRPIEHVTDFPCENQHTEDNYTEDYILKYGIENVRGGSYCQVNLPDHQIQTIETKHRSQQNACYKCKGLGHYARECTSSNSNKSESPSKRSRHEYNNEHDRCDPTARDKTPIRDNKEQSEELASGSLRSPSKRFKIEFASPSKASAATTNTCSRCGRDHMTSECVATVHGKRLSKKTNNSSSSSSSISSSSVICYRCGRGGHIRPDCYARTTIDGDELSDDDDQGNNYYWDDDSDDY